MSKSGAAIATLRHASTSDDVMVPQRPISNIEVTEHQMMEDEGQEVGAGATTVNDLNQAMSSTDQT